MKRPCKQCNNKIEKFPLTNWKEIRLTTAIGSSAAVKIVSIIATETQLKSKRIT
jgi:homoserine kinase